MHGSLGALHAQQGTLHLLNADGYQAPRGTNFPAHRHQAWEVVYYRRGRVDCPIGDRVYEAGPGTVLLTPPDTTHAEVARTDYANFYMVIDAPSAQVWPTACFDADQALLHVCSALVREWTGRAPESGALIRALLAQLDILVRRAAALRQLPATERLILAAERLIEEQFAEPLTLVWVVEQLGVAAQTLRAHFAAARSYSPHGYLQQVRLSHVLALIRGSSLSLEAVASTSGYCSASHLSRHVKHATGVRPGATRAQGEAGSNRSAAVYSWGAERCRGSSAPGCWVLCGWG